MNTINQLLSIQALGPIIGLILVSSITLHAYRKHKKQNKPCLLPNTCKLLQKEIYLLNQEIDKTNDTDKLEELTHKLLNLEEHLTSLQDYDIRNYPKFDWKVALVLLLISAVGLGTIAGIFILIF